MLVVHPKRKSPKIANDAARFFIFVANVPDHLLPLAFVTKACSAGDVPKVPKAWELSASACSAVLFCFWRE